MPKFFIFLIEELFVWDVLLGEDVVDLRDHESTAVHLVVAHGRTRALAQCVLQVFLCEVRQPVVNTLVGVGLNKLLLFYLRVENPSGLDNMAVEHGGARSFVLVLEFGLF